MRKSHPDARYVAVILQYVKHFAVSLTEHIIMLSLDDKAIIPVGEPDNPISTGVHGHHRSLVTLGGPTLAALDHDSHLFGIVPSVSLVIEIPDSPNDSFFTGQPFVSSKDKITQPSSPYRHSAELVQLVRANYSDDGLSASKPVMIILSDGGPDHRVTFGSVQMSMVALFSCLDLDILVCMQMCPYQSWTNPAERVMSTLNLALQNVSLMRDKMDDKFERAIRNKNTLSAVRSEVQEMPDLQPALQESTSEVICLLEERFSRMKLKGNHIKVYPAASHDDVVDNFESVHFIDSSLCMANSTQATLKDAEDYQAFLTANCSSSHYLFQIKKCGKDTCSFCSRHPIRLPPSEFEKFKFVPLLLLNLTKDHYKSYSELYGQPPSEADRPSSVVTSDAKAADIENKKLLIASKVRGVIVCVECNKPRCVYAASTLSYQKKTLLKLAKDTNIYTCGSELFPPNTPLHGTIVCRQALTCTHSMEAPYYSSSCTTFPPVCWYCASPEEMLADDELVQDLRSVCRSSSNLFPVPIRWETSCNMGCLQCGSQTVKDLIELNLAVMHSFWCIIHFFCHYIFHVMHSFCCIWH